MVPSPSRVLLKMWNLEQMSSSVSRGGRTSQKKASRAFLAMLSMLVNTDQTEKAISSLFCLRSSLWRL